MGMETGMWLLNITQLLNSIAGELDLMLSDLYQAYPYPQDHASLTSDKTASIDHGLVEHYMTGLDEDGDEEEEDDVFGTGAELVNDIQNNSLASINLELHTLNDFQPISRPDTPQSSQQASTIRMPHPVPAAPPAFPREEPTAPIPLQDRLIHTHPIWYLPNISRLGAIHLLQAREPGSFIVRQSSKKKDTLALSVRLLGHPNVDHYLIEPTRRGLRLEGSFRCFTSIPALVAYYCDYLEELPVRLVLPLAIMQAKSHQELTSLALLGQDFWTSSFAWMKPAVWSLTGQEFQVSPPSSEFPTLATSTGPNRNAQVTCVVPPKSAFMKTFKEETRELSRVSHSTAVSQVKTSCSVLETNKTLTCSEVTVTANKNTGTGPGGPLYMAPSSDTCAITQSKQFNQNTVNGSVDDRRTSPYHMTEVADTISDYEDIWSTRSSVSELLAPPVPAKSEKVDSDTCREKTKRPVDESDTESGKRYISTTFISIQNPGFVDDSDTESVRNSRSSPFFTDGSFLNLRPEHCSTMESQTEVHECFEPVEIDVRVPCNSESFVLTSPPMLTSHHGQPVLLTSAGHYQTPPLPKPIPTSHGRTKPPPLPPVAPLVSQQTQTESEPLSACGSTLSSPGYIEPFDSLLPKVGVKSRVHGAIKVTESSLGQLGPQRPCHLPAPPKVTQQRHSAPLVEVPPSETNEVRLVQSNTFVSFIGPESETEKIRMRHHKNHSHSPINKTSANTVWHISPPSSYMPGQRSSAIVESQAPPIPHRQYISEPALRKPASSANVSNHAGSNVETVYPAVSQSFEQQFSHEEKRHSQSPQQCAKFPVSGSHTSFGSNRTSFSDVSTVEDLISNDFPDLTVKPIQPLTVGNIQRISEYDNLRHGIGSARGHVASSVGTPYCKPWDSSLWQDLMQLGDSAHQPRFSMPPIAKETISPHQGARRNGYISGESDYSDCYNTYDTRESGNVPSDGQSDCGSVAASFEWRDSAHSSTRDITPLPPLRDSSVVSEAINFTAGPLDGQLYTTFTTDDEDEGVEEDQDVRAESFQNRLMPFISTPRLISLRNRGKDPGLKVRDHVCMLAQDQTSYFGKSVENFIQCTQEGAETNPHIVMRNVRQFMNGIKNYLVQNLVQKENSQLHNIIEQERNKLDANEFLNIDAIVEGALHKTIVRPLKQHIYKLFVDEYTKNDSLKLLSDNIKYARTKTTAELGLRKDIIPPEGTSMEVIKHFLTKMQKAYSPLKKLENLLGATSSIYNSVQGAPSDQVGREAVSISADDFLPMFIYVLVHCGVVSAEIEADYMWGLLHPSLLAGEGGYYLTTLSSAVHVLKNFKASSEQDQMAMPGRLPTISDLQGFMKIVIPDEKNDSIITKTLPVRPNMTAKDVCSMIAHKFKITNPQDYGLYLLLDAAEDKLEDNVCPQKIKAEVLSEGRHCAFAYKRNNAKFAWPIHFQR